VRTENTRPFIGHPAHILNRCATVDTGVPGFGIQVGFPFMVINLVKPGTTSGRVCLKNLGRAEALVSFFDKDAEGRDRPNNHARELLRSAIVFTVGALDAYLRDLVLELVPKYRPQSPSLTDAFKAIVKDDPGIALRVALADEGERLEEFRRALDKWLTDKSFHGPQKVQQALDYIGCEISWDTFDKSLGITKSAKSLEAVTKKRHDIVHRLDDLPIERDETVEAIDLVRKVVVLIDRQACLRFGLQPRA
jgi:hypothetical protein